MHGGCGSRYQGNTRILDLTSDADTMDSVVDKHPNCGVFTATGAPGPLPRLDISWWTCILVDLF